MHKSFWAVHVNWNADNDGWNVEANSVENPNMWNDGNHSGCHPSGPTGARRFKIEEWRFKNS